MTPEESQQAVNDFLDAMVAGYHPMIYKRWIKPANCTSDEQVSQLLHLLRSIERGEPEETKRLLVGLDPNLRLTSANRTESLLEFAVDKACHPDCIREIVAAGGNIKEPLLLRKVLSGRNTGMLEELLQAGMEVQLGANDGGFLCGVPHDLLEVLLTRGADTEMKLAIPVSRKKQNTNATALMHAASVGDAKRVQILLKAGAKVDARDGEDNTPLDWAKTLRNKSKSEKVIRLLVEAGAVDSGKQSKPEEVVDFAERSKSEEFKQAIELVKGLTRAAAKSVELSEGKLAGAKAFSLRKVKPTFEFLSEVRNVVTPLNAMVFFSENTYGENPEEPILVLLPTADYREAIIAFETPEGQSIDSHELNMWLMELERTQPFIITHIMPDTVRAVFTTPLAEPEKLAKGIQGICPEVTEVSPEFVKRLEQSRELHLWWD